MLHGGKLLQTGLKGEYGMIAANKRRVAVTVDEETFEQARNNAQKLGMTLSGYVNTVLKAVGTENMQDAFDVVLNEVVQAVARQKRDEGKAV